MPKVLDLDLRVLRGGLFFIFFRIFVPTRAPRPNFDLFNNLKIWISA